MARSRVVEADGLDELVAAARRLRDLDPGRFATVLRLCRTYVAAYDRLTESDEIFTARLVELRGSGRKNSA